jgi:hypothetical protein
MPMPVPIIEMKNDVMNPTPLPAHQPTDPPMVAPMKESIFPSTVYPRLAAASSAFSRNENDAPHLMHA